MRENLTFSAVGEYFAELNAFMDSQVDQKAAARLLGERLSSNYFMNIMTELAAINSLHEEICKILNDLYGRDMLLVKYLPVEHLKLLSKFYIIQWSTLSDMMSSLINKVCNLGVADRDINLAMILRNAHVRKTELPAIYRKHQAQIEYGKYSRYRNEIIHRGQVEDPQIKELESEWNNLHSSRHSLFRESNISDEDYQKSSEALTSRNYSLGAARQAQYRDHYGKTLDMITEILKALARKNIELYEKDAI